MNPALGFGGRDALDAMAAALEAEALEGAVARDGKDDFLVAAHLAGAEGDGFDVPAHAAGVARVHLVEVAGEQGRLVAASAGADFDDEAVVILGAGQEEILQSSRQRIAASTEVLQLLFDDG